MTTADITDITESLSEIRDAVAVPPIDPADFEARVRYHHRRRRAARAAGALALTAVAATAVGVVPLALDRSEPTPIATAVRSTGVPVVLDGRVQEVAADGTVTDTGLSGAPIGRLGGQLVVLDGDRILGLADGPIDHVVSAFVDQNGVSYATSDGLIVFAGPRGQHSAQLRGTLLAAGGSVFVDDEGDGPLIHDPAGVHPIELGSDGGSVDLDRVEVGGDTVVLVHDGGVEVYDASGERRSGFLGGTAGALSDDGTTYAYAPSAAELDAGMLPGLARYDTRTGQLRRAPLADPAVDLRWVDEDLFVVTQGSDGRTLWQCGERLCGPLLTDPESTLELG